MVELTYAKTSGQPFVPETFENGDSRKQLLARSRYLLFKKDELWSESQRKRARILFREYPDILSDAENRASVGRTIRKLRDYLNNLEDKMEELL